MVTPQPLHIRKRANRCQEPDSIFVSEETAVWRENRKHTRKHRGESLSSETQGPHLPRLQWGDDQVNECAFCTLVHSIIINFGI